MFRSGIKFFNYMKHLREKLASEQNPREEVDAKDQVCPDIFVYFGDDKPEDRTCQ